jgi:hypothetical protein
MTSCSLAGNISKEHITSIFRVEENSVGKVAGYVEVGQKETSHV